MLVLFSPYIKLHARLKDNLLLHKENTKLEIIIVFGKNEEKIEKSLSKIEFEFLAQFPNIEIRYNSRLHAKYYENDNTSIFSSMNLYEHSHNNNIEFGIQVSVFGNKIGKDAHEYFWGVYQNSDLMFKKKPEYNKTFAGLKSTYTHSKVEVDKLSEVYKDKEKSFSDNYSSKIDSTKINFISITKLSESIGVNKKELDTLFEQKAWISKEGKSWKLTDEGVKVGGIIKKWQKGEYIAFPENIKEKINLQQ